MTDPFHSTEQNLRRAAAEQRYSDVGRLLAEYYTAARSQLEGLPSGDYRVSKLRERMEYTLSWTNQMLVIGRASLAHQLAHLPLVDRYLTQPDSAGMLRLDA